MGSLRLVILFLLIPLAAACDRLGSDNSAAFNEASANLPAEETALDDSSGWPTIGGSPLEQYFSPVSNINRENIGELGLAWFLELDTNRGQEATPIIVDRTLFSTTAWSKVIAVDAASGRLKWQYDPKVPGPAARKGCCDVVNRGLAYSDGKLFSATLDGRLIALDAKTGDLVWSVQTLDDKWPYTITGAPRVAKGKVFIGNSGADFGVRGYVSAYDTHSGDLVWRFYTVPGDPSAGPDNTASDDVLASTASPTWFGSYWKYGGGGTVWDAIVYDSELDQLYIGVGNGSPWNHRIRSDGRGDNLFLSSIVALDPDTGKYLWHYQQNPAETWDFTATQPIILADLNIEGKDRKVLMQAPKNGFFYVLDRHSGELISAKNFVPTSWATHIDLETGRPVETDNARYSSPEVALPSSPGAHNWHPMAYSPDTGYVYIPAQSIPFLLKEDDQFKFRPGKWNLGIDLNAAPLPETEGDIEELRNSLSGSLIAWDPVNQSMAWKVEHQRPVNGGVLATAGGLVFQGQSNGIFHAYDATTGEALWEFDAQSGIVAAPMSYRMGGVQYVALLVGYGGATAMALPELYDTKPRIPGRLLVFTLGGSAELPELPSVGQPFITAEDLSVDDVERGRLLYADRCSTCHGAGVLSANVVPDLRRSPFQATSASWHSIVIEGLLSDNGMVSFREEISSEDAESIRVYVQKQARLLKQRGEQHTTEGAE